MPFWYDEVFKDVSRFGLYATEKLFEGRSPYQKVVVLDTPGFGRTLLLDDLFMTSERDEHLYHEMIVHPALTTARRIERVLVIGGGDGGTVREVLSYPEVRHVTMVEIDGLVVDVSKRFLGSIGSAWDDPRLNVIIGDGIEYVKNAQVEKFDVILLDGSDPVGPAEGLFTKSFHEGCLRLLREGGVYALQSESPFIQRKVFLETVATLGEVFSHVHPYFGWVPIYTSGMWSWTFCSNDVNPLTIDEARMLRAEARTKHYNRDIHRAAFAVPNDIQKLLKK